MIDRYFWSSIVGVVIMASVVIPLSWGILTMLVRLPKYNARQLDKRYLKKIGSSFFRKIIELAVMNVLALVVMATFIFLIVLVVYLYKDCVGMVGSFTEVFFPFRYDAERCVEAATKTLGGITITF